MRWTRPGRGIGWSRLLVFSLIGFGACQNHVSSICSYFISAIAVLRLPVNRMVLRYLPSVPASCSAADQSRLIASSATDPRNHGRSRFFSPFHGLSMPVIGDDL